MDVTEWIAAEEFEELKQRRRDRFFWAQPVRESFYFLFLNNNGYVSEVLD